MNAFIVTDDGVVLTTVSDTDDFVKDSENEPGDEELQALDHSTEKESKSDIPIA